jgi:peptidylprolyl isomerase
VTQARRAATLVVAFALATVTACGSGDAGQKADLKDRIGVSGGFGARPSIRIRTPLDVPATSWWVGSAGAGDRVAATSTVILQLTMANGRTGKTAISTTDGGQQPLQAAIGDELFPSLAQALVGKPAHSRVVVASTPDDAYGDQGLPQAGIKGTDPVVMVADILSTDPTTVLHGPTGASRPSPPGAPSLREQDGVPVALDFAGARKPSKLQVIPLREGTGPVVADPDRIAAKYLLQLWGAKQPLEENFSKEPSLYSIGLSRVVKAWDLGLVGLREGARVMLVCPPDVAYGAAAQPGMPANSTLVFVLDVLGVGGGGKP